MTDSPLATLRRAETGLDDEFVDEFIERLDESYFESVPAAEILADARELARIDPNGAMSVRSARLDHEEVLCVVYGHDFPGLLSIVCGLLAVSGFDIRSGTIHTYRYSTETRVYTQRRAGRIRSVEHEIPKPRKIIDRFVGTITDGGDYSIWRERFQSLLEQAQTRIDGAGSHGTEAISAARRFVYEEVSRSLSERNIDTERTLYPVTLSITDAPRGGTRLTVLTEDTPFFLFTLTTAVALQETSIESVRITTTGTRVEDEIDLYDSGGLPLTGADRIDRIKLSILFTKQFTYFLGKAPDPEAALIRFEALCTDILGRSSSEALTHMLGNPAVMRDLARVLGASDFLWEEFIRVQYESLLPMLDRHARFQDLSHSPEELDRVLDRLLESQTSVEEKIRVVNEFKNREIYLIDLDHIMNPDRDFLFLSERLTTLAEIVVARTVRIACEELTARYGRPTGFAGIEASWAVLGLGKFGGAALGYASDIELLFVYSDTGETSGPERIGNADFFERCFRNTVHYIEAKQEGIFHIDLRLRPHGNGGPLAVSVDSFCRYYGRGGGAHSYERLALVRMRAFAGDRALGEQVERLRDEMIYATDSIDVGELRDVRNRQFAEKHVPGRVNAKFSPGALVDLEYSVQIIQCRSGESNPALRTPRIHVALEELVRAGILESDEATRLVESYHFLRRLINGLRMLRGSAKDLFLPEIGSSEYSHLARRIGYVDDAEMSAARRLQFDFEARTAMVRQFVESRLGRESLPGSVIGNAADLVLSDSMAEERRARILEGAGFRNLTRADTIIRSMRGEGERRSLFARIAVLAWDLVGRLPDPDMALNNWDRFVASLDNPILHFRRLLEQPRMLEVLLGIFSGSQFLADTLAGTPSFLDWVADPARLHRLRDGNELREELSEPVSGDDPVRSWMDRARTIRKREILRIGTRDLCLAVPLPEIVEELSIVADEFIEAALRTVWPRIVPEAAVRETGFCLFAFGKLGGRELNYSSDIDLLATYRVAPEGIAPAEVAGRLANVVESLRALLSDYTGSGYVYRVDLRLRPYGRAGSLVPRHDATLDYYRSHAAPWERQALLKLRPVAGDLKAGNQLRRELENIIRHPAPGHSIRSEIARLRSIARRTHASELRGLDIKNGRGGIRDIEFLVQGLQLEHAARFPDLVEGNTLTALDRLHRNELIGEQDRSSLLDDYLSLRRIEHALQLLEDRQVHSLPIREDELTALARRLHGVDETAAALVERVTNIAARVSARFDSYIGS